MGNTPNRWLHMSRTMTKNLPTSPDQSVPLVYGIGLTNRVFFLNGVVRARQCSHTAPPLTQLDFQAAFSKRYVIVQCVKRNCRLYRWLAYTLCAALRPKCVHVVAGQP